VGEELILTVILWPEHLNQCYLYDKIFKNVINPLYYIYIGMNKYSMPYNKSVTLDIYHIEYTHYTGIILLSIYNRKKSIFITIY